MEDYIYILLGVLWLGASIYRASQKKKEKGKAKTPATATPKPETRGSQARTLLEEILGGQEVSIPEPLVQEVEYEEPIMLEVEDLGSSKSFQKEYAEYSFGELESVSGEGIRSIDRIDFKDQMPLQENNPSKALTIDLRKAIIYKAILERPYT